MKKTILLIIFSLISSLFYSQKHEHSCSQEKNLNEIRLCGEMKAKSKEINFLKKEIFNGLKNQNKHSNKSSVYYFNETDFEKILLKTKKLNVGISLIQTTNSKGIFYDLKTIDTFLSPPKSNDSKWYTKAFIDFKKAEKGLLYTAIYEIPRELLIE